MEELIFRYPARQPITKRIQVGVVASGDLEILLEPAENGQSTFIVRTSVPGFTEVWQLMFERFMQTYDRAVRVEINDAGATPGVVALRLAQAMEGVLSV